MSARRVLGAAAVLLALQAPAALACGVCLEDRVATVYDHAVVTQALGARHHVAFCAVDGGGAGLEELRHDIERALGSIVGVDRGSTRVSADNTSVSFAFDPARTQLETVLRAARRKLAHRSLTLAPLRVMDRPAELKPAAPPR